MKILHFTRDNEDERPIEYVVFTEDEDGFQDSFGTEGFSLALVAEIDFRVEQGRELLPMDRSLVPYP